MLKNINERIEELGANDETRARTIDLLTYEISEIQNANLQVGEEDELINNLKHIIYLKLNEVDKRIILMYAELKSLRKLGMELGISVSSAWIKINEIRDKIYKELENYD